MRSFHVERATAESMREILVTNASRKIKLFTDESCLYSAVGTEFVDHDTVTHSNYEYVRGEVHTDTS